MKVILDGQVLRMYPLGKPGFKGGTEQYVAIIAHGLAERGHTVHVVTPDLEEEEQRGEREWWWGPRAHPTRADVVVAVHNLASLPGYVAQHFILAPNGIDPWVGDDGAWAGRLSAIACFSQAHIDLLTSATPTVPRDLCHITGLGVNLSDYKERYDADHWHPQIIAEQKHGTLRGGHVHGRLLWANDPSRGLHHLLPIFDCIRKKIPKAELLIAYDFARQFEGWRYQANCIAERLWECQDRINQGDGVRNLGQVSRETLVDLQRSCDIHVMPSDPLNVGSQIHGLTQLEMAAAGVPLILSDIEAFPEIFPAAVHLPVPGSFQASAGRRFDAQDWAERAIEIMKDRNCWRAGSAASLQMAAGHDWSAVLDRWDAMLTALPLD